MPASRSKRTRSLADLVRVEAALERALQEALGLHMRLGHAVPEWADDQLVWVQPAELLKNGNGHKKARARKGGGAAKSRRGARRSRG